MCWLLWKSRNERLFEGKDASVAEIVGKCQFWVSTTSSAFHEARRCRDSHAPIRHEVAISWQGAADPYSTLNTDGFVIRPTNHAASGGVLRDNRGNCTAAFACNLGACSITRAKLHGIVEGMELAWNMGVRHLEVHVDSACAITLLSKSTHSTSQHEILIHISKLLMQRDWIVNLKHIYREDNHVADAMANLGHTLDYGTHLIPLSHNRLSHWLFYDSLDSYEHRQVVAI
ncbi:Putative ribonuclease H protein At1g65750 [Linum grandiflorum]